MFGRKIACLGILSLAFPVLLIFQALYPIHFFRVLHASGGEAVCVRYTVVKSFGCVDRIAVRYEGLRGIATVTMAKR